MNFHRDTEQPTPLKTAPDALCERGLIGKPLPRVEDARLLRGQSRYVSDIVAKTTAVQVAILRSPHVHAVVRSVDISAARAVAGVVDVITATDLVDVAPLPCDWAPDMRYEALHPVLAADKVRYDGEPIVAVVATTKHAAQDAREAIDIAYEVLPAVADEAALAPNAPRIHPAADNVALHATCTSGDYARARREADVVLTRRLTTTGVPRPRWKDEPCFRRLMQRRARSPITPRCWRQATDWSGL